MGLRENKSIVISSHKAHMDSEVWNTGNDSDPHPVDNFWAEHFLVYPKDSGSGPLNKKKTVPWRERKPTSNSDSMTEGIDLDQSTSPRFTLDGLAGSWISHGGGQRLCPGRQFAKQEMILPLASLVLASEFELRVRLGALRPSKYIPCKVRRRV